ncbi:MAG: APC family permease [Hyphomicrobiaceae bacterium]
MSEATDPDLAAGNRRKAGLRRSLTLWHVVLYGLGVTIGAGIYVLIGDAAGSAGTNAPFAFVVAALVMAPTALSLAELATRHPVSAGEAAFVGAAFRWPALSVTVGSLVVGVGIVSAAAISLGSVGYIRVFVDLPPGVLLTLVVLGMGLIAAWGIEESVTLAAIMTVIEIGGLLIVVVASLVWHPESLPAVAGTLVPTLGTDAWLGILSAGLIAFFAFIGFEGIVNVAEEVKAPTVTLRRAIYMTLLISTILYLLVAAVSVVIVPPAELSRSDAPLALVFERATGASPLWLSAIAIIATLNGVIVQMIMASRVIYGLADRGNLPKVLASVSPTTSTPLISTGLVVAIVYALALLLPLVALAEWTSRITLVVFALVNAALIRIKLRGDPAPAGVVIQPMAVPVAGCLICLAFLLAGGWS